MFLFLKVMVIRPTTSYLLANLSFFCISPRNTANHSKLLYRFLFCVILFEQIKNCLPKTF